MRHPLYKIGPQKTPTIMQTILFLTGIASLFCALQVSFFPHFPLQHGLSLSWLGVTEHFYWQPLTYLFLVPSDGISVSFFFNLAFHLYLIWVFGTSLLERVGSLHFFILFFGSGLVASLFGLLAMSVSYPFYQLSGSSIVLYSILTAWLMLNPGAELKLFFAIPFQAKWIFLLFLGLPLLLAFSDWDFVTFFSYLSSSVFGYLYVLCLYHVHSPLPFLHQMERRVIAFFHKRKEKRMEKKAHLFHEAKTYDIKTGNPIISDEEFMEAMLSKISLYGEGFLTKEEKARMQKISKERREKKKKES